METRSFKKGLGDAPKRHQVLIRKEIMQMIGIKSRVQWANRRDGKVDHSPAEVTAINEIFIKYGVNNPWGDS